MTTADCYDCIVVGGGFGGLAAAIRLAKQGYRVHLLEKDNHLGGKAGSFVDGDFRSDTGPSVLTMIDEAIELLSLGHNEAHDYVSFVQSSPAFRYIYDDGTVLDIHHDIEDTRQSVQSILGEEALQEFDAFLSYSRRIWEGSAPLFVQAPAPHWVDLLTLAFRQLSLIPQMDPLRSMKNGIARFVSNPYLVDLFLRYATYNGSDPRQAPATLNCIAHVELAMGGYGVVGGIEALVEGLGLVALENNVSMDLNCTVTHISPTPSGHRIESTRGTYQSKSIVVNADASHLRNHLLGAESSRAFQIPEPYSMSGWTAIYEVSSTSQADRVGHTVLFPKEYLQEFIDIFDGNKPPTDPTIYICAQHRCHKRKRTANNTEALFVMVNTPPEHPTTPTSSDVWTQLEQLVRGKLEDKGVLPADAVLKWVRTPSDLAAQYPGSRGAIYGSSSNNRFAAFTRPPNQIAKIKGMFLASGSAHPGGGMPMAMISGKHAAQACHQYLSTQDASLYPTN